MHISISPAEQVKIAKELSVGEQTLSILPRMAWVVSKLDNLAIAPQLLHLL